MGTKGRFWYCTSGNFDLLVALERAGEWDRIMKEKNKKKYNNVNYGSTCYKYNSELLTLHTLRYFTILSLNIYSIHVKLTNSRYY